MTAATCFDPLTRPTRVDDRRFTVDVPAGWEQGRGAFGGMVVAILARAAEAAVADPGRTLRSLTAELVGPLLPGPADVAVEILRAGSGLTAVAARAVQAGEVQAHAVAAFGRPRAAYERAPSIAPPAMPPWREVAPAPVGPPHAPTFTQHVEYRPVAAPRVAGAPVTGGWIRLRDPGAARDAIHTAALIDGWWPALDDGVPTRPLATFAYSFQAVAGTAGLDPDAPLFYRGRILAGGDGYAVELRELWGEDGRLVALNQQTIVVIR